MRIGFFLMGYGINLGVKALCFVVIGAVVGVVAVIVRVVVAFAAVVAVAVTAFHEAEYDRGDGGGQSGRGSFLIGFDEIFPDGGGGSDVENRGAQRDDGADKRTCAALFLTCGGQRERYRNAQRDYQHEVGYIRENAAYVGLGSGGNRFRRARGACRELL